jgi:D-alanine-D-alanine ligase
MNLESRTDERIAASESPADGATSQESSRRVVVLVDEIAELEAVATGQLAPNQSTSRIFSALEALGYEPAELAMRPGKAAEWLERLMADDYQVAFNLCETLGGSAEGEHLPAAAVELLDLPMTGARSATLLFCLYKDRCSAVLHANGIPVPDWKLVGVEDALPTGWTTFPAIVKPAADDASNGVHPSSVVNTEAELTAAIERLRKNWDLALIQQYIEGREINLAIVGRHVLPPAEIDFSTLPDGAPAIVSFEAKWESSSAEFLGTRPICPAPLQAEQAEQLQRLAARVWSLMDGRGYARVDVRLTSEGIPYVIDVNPNPDLSLDAGLARQAKVAGWSYDDLIGKIVEEALANGVADRGLADWILVAPQTTAGEAR